MPSSKRLAFWAVAVLVALGILAFAAFVGGARLSPATLGLALCGVTLVYAITSLYRVVGALATTEANILLQAQSMGAVASLRELREEKKRVLRAIKELDFDHEMGKISDADHQTIRGGYERRALEVLRALEGTSSMHPDLQRELSKITGSGSDGAPPDPSPASPAREEPPVTDGVPAAIHDAGPTAAGCMLCGTSNDPDAKFCKSCGVSLAG